MKEDKP